jgi:hypothetical protein
MRKKIWFGHHINGNREMSVDTALRTLGEIDGPRYGVKVIDRDGRSIRR